MAKTNGKKKKKQRGTMSETQRWVLGVALFLFGLFLLTAVIGYFFYWEADQAFAQWGGTRAVSNPAGKTGAWLANLIVGEWFGFFGILIPAIFIIGGLRIINGRRDFLSKYIRISVILLILGSLTLGLAFSPDWKIFGTGPGGAHGYFVSDKMREFLGTAGAGLVLLLGWILLGVYINSRRTISVVNKVGKSIYDSGAIVGNVVAEKAGELTHRGREPEPEDDPIEEAPFDPDPVWDPEDVEEPEKPDDKGFEITDSRQIRLAEEPVAEPEPAKEVPETDPNVMMLGQEPSADIFRRTGKEKVVDDPDSVSYVGGLGVYAERFADKAPDVAKDIAGDYSDDIPEAKTTDSPFEVIDLLTGEARTLSAGGVVESTPDELESADAAKGMRVVSLGKSDVQLEEEDIESKLYDPTKELSKYQRPPVEILEDHSVDVQVTEEEVYENKNQIVRTLENFGIRIDKIKATIGPTVTLYEIIPAAGIKISKIKNLEDDIALSLKALGIRIIAPMPGKGTVGIEVPNKDKEIVSMYSVVKTMKFQESKYELPVVLGKTISNETFVIDLANMPHLLVAGATGQGKSVGLNAIITSLLYKKHPAELKFVMVDPKRVELSLYAKLERHFLAKMESEDDAILTDTQKVVYTLNALCELMSERYDLLRQAEVKKISEYNTKFLQRRLNPNKGHKFLPYIVVVVDEFADMIMTAGREVEAPITRLAQLARAVGIHLIIATQRPDVKVITGLIKANFPARIAFRVTSMVDSRTIIDQPGANQLIGRGDMLFSINGEITRVQCAFIDTPEIERITEFISNQKGYGGAYALPDYHPDSDMPAKEAELDKLDPMFEEVARFVVQNQQGSTSSIQRRFSIGYNRAGRIMDQLEAAGVVGRAEGSKPREVLLLDVLSLERNILERLG